MLVNFSKKYIKHQIGRKGLIFTQAESLKKVTNFVKNHQGLSCFLKMFKVCLKFSEKMLYGRWPIRFCKCHILENPWYTTDHLNTSSTVVINFCW